MSELRHRIAVQNPSSRVFDGDGGYTDGYASANPATVAAKVEPATAAVIERVVGATVDAKISHLVTMRYHAGVTTKSQVVLGSRVFDVRGVQNVGERGEWLVLACEEALSGGN